MKFFLSILLIFSHLFSTIGVCAEMHECGGVISYSVFNLQLSDDSCECNHDSSDHQDEDCCQSKKLEIKADNTAKNTFKTIVLKANPCIVYNSQQLYFSFKRLKLYQEQSFNYSADFPPGYSPPKFLLYNSFLI